MQMMLIYRGSRLPGTGFVTLLAGSAPDAATKAQAEHVAQAALMGQPRPGSTFVHRTVAVEGRQADDLLILHHDTALPPARQESLRSALQRAYDNDLRVAFERARAPHTDPAAARAIVQSALDRIARALTQAVVAEPPTTNTRHVDKVARRVLSIRAIGGIAVFLALVLVACMLWSNLPRSTPVAEYPKAPAENKDLSEILNSCWPDIDPEKLAELQAKFSEEALRSHDDGGIRNRMQRLRAGDAQYFGDVEKDDRRVCDDRKEFWNKIDELRNREPGIKEPYNSAFTDNGIQDDAGLAAAAHAFWTMEFPETPADCAAGVCLSLFDSRDLEAAKIIESAYEKLPRSLADGDELRRAEVTFRGELALRGKTFDPGSYLAEFWHCDGSVKCSRAMQETINRLLLKQ